MKAAVIANSIAVKRCAADWRRIEDYIKNSQFSFCIINIGNFSALESVWHMPKLYRGKHLGSKKVSHSWGRKVEASADGEVLLELDGELVGTLPATFEVVPAAINIRAR